jgi:8-oxo-dGTP diphosphatase
MTYFETIGGLFERLGGMTVPRRIGPCLGPVQVLRFHCAALELNTTHAGQNGSEISMPSTRQAYSYDYPRPAVTVDVALVTREVTPRILLIRRKHHPFAGRWALPGGFVDENEPLETAARRELQEETGLAKVNLEQLYTFGDPGRDPRGWTVTVVYLARVDFESVEPHAADDASEVGWFSFDHLPELAFDHAEVLSHVQARLINRDA